MRLKAKALLKFLLNALEAIQEVWRETSGNERSDRSWLLRGGHRAGRTQTSG
jgi:hypothetical protein